MLFYNNKSTAEVMTLTTLITIKNRENVGMNGRMREP